MPTEHFKPYKKYIDRGLKMLLTTAAALCDDEIQLDCTALRIAGRSSGCLISLSTPTA